MCQQTRCKSLTRTNRLDSYIYIWIKIQIIEKHSQFYYVFVFYNLRKSNKSEWVRRHVQTHALALFSISRYTLTWSTNDWECMNLQNYVFLFYPFTIHNLKKKKLQTMFVVVIVKDFPVCDVTTVYSPVIRPSFFASTCTKSYLK